MSGPVRCAGCHDPHCNDCALSIWVVYGPNTSDYPGHYVAREQRAVRGGKLYFRAVGIVCGSLDEAREAVAFAAGPLHRLPRYANDDPTILETWI